MESFVIWSGDAKAWLPELSICIGIAKNVKVARSNEQVEALRRSIMNEVQRAYNIESLKDNPVVRAYRDLFWKLGVDPTKTRPSGEALLRRVLHGDEIPRISTAVDAYNLASLKTIIPISGFDLDFIRPPLHIRFSRENEEFYGIGMKNSVRLTDKMLVVADRERIVCIYPYRDAEATKITENTRNVLIIAYSAPGIHQKQLISAVETTLLYIHLTSGGKTETIKLF